MKAAAYIRVSSQKQVDEGLSLDNQKFCIGNFAAMDDIQEIDFFVDEGISGRKIENRKGLKSLLEKLEDYDRLYIYSLTRLGRNAAETLGIISLIEKSNTILCSYTERLDFGTPAGKMFSGILATLGEYESNLISERVKGIVDYNKEKGLKYSQPIFGFDQSKEKSEKELEVNDREASIIKTIYKWRFKSEMSYENIAERLNKNNWLTKYNCKWRRNSVRRVLEKESLYRKHGIIN